MNIWLARFLVFFSSASVLVLEILAARLLAPYLGVSLEVFTGIIGVILAGISLGAWLGGRAADRTEPSILLGPLFVVGGILSLVSPLLADAIGPSLTTSAYSIVTAAAFAFVLPAAVLSAIPPVIVKIQLASLDETGRVVGSYSAIGTAGAIFGTFVTGFVLISAFPTRPTVSALGLSLTVIGAILWASRGRWALLSIGVAALVAGWMITAPTPCQFETTYHCALVEVDDERSSGRTLWLDRLPNSYVDIEDPTYLEFRYIRLFTDIMETASPPGPLDVVSIGGGGFTMPGYVEATRPGSTNVVLEIDSELVEIGKRELSLSDEVDVIVDDARISLRDVESADVVLGDAYSGASVPWHLTTVEYKAQIRDVLGDSGIYIMNVIDSPGQQFLRAQAATLSTVFDNVVLFAPPSYLAGEAGGNFVFAASQSEVDVTAIETAIRSRGGREVGLTGVGLDDLINGASVLTDDFAPVDQLLRSR